GDLQRMDTLARESLGLAWAGGLMDRIADSLRQLAAVAAGLGFAARSARLLGAAARLQERVGLLQSPGARELLDRTIVSTRAALGEEAYSTAHAEGRTLALEDAVAFAREEF